MRICYLINGSRYYDEAMLRERIGLSKSSLHVLLTNNIIKPTDIIFYQNRMLVSLDNIKTFIKESKVASADRITQLSDQKKKKMEDYNKIPSNDWKKQLKKFELELIEIKMKIENLKRTHS
jgi:hypothetical protein